MITCSSPNQLIRCLRTPMSVPKVFTISVPMPFETIPRGLITAHASPENLGMAESAKIRASVIFCNIKLREAPMKEISHENVKAL